MIPAQVETRHSVVCSTCRAWGFDSNEARQRNVFCVRVRVCVLARECARMSARLCVQARVRCVGVCACA